MRDIKALSYSALTLWEKQPEEYYLKYLAPNRPPRAPQERPAAVGSAFDARAKSCLYEALFGANDPKYTYEALFEAQVEPHNRDWAGPEGDYVFERYKFTGFYDELLAMLQVSPEAPRFEFTVEAEIGGVQFLGKPDCRFKTPLLVPVIHDWKVSGYCSKSTTSPTKGYQLCRDAFTAEKQSKSHNKEHNAYLAYQHRDITINIAFMEAFCEKWADQLTTYGWCLGEKVGDEDVVLSVHEIVGKPVAGSRPELRVSQYRARVAADYQRKLLGRLQRCWEAITTGYVFPDLSREDNDSRCLTLNDVSVGLQSDGSSNEDYFNTITRAKYRG
jgi:hypothetical protein